MRVEIEMRGGRRRLASPRDARILCALGKARLVEPAPEPAPEPVVVATPPVEAPIAADEPEQTGKDSSPVTDEAVMRPRRKYTRRAKPEADEPRAYLRNDLTDLDTK
jgi:hypothetical protein